VGWIETRYNDDGEPRYVAKYRDIRGRKQTAGTFGDAEAAKKAWQEAESKVQEGRGTALVRGKRNFERYVRDTWFPNHRLELRARENYGYYLDKRIIPWFKHMRLIEVMPDDVREFVTHLENGGVPASSIQYCLTILSAIFTTALNDQAVFFHPCRGVSGPTVAKKVRRIVTPEQYDLFHQALAEQKWQLLAETDIESGLRWGELTELRPRDLDARTCKIRVTRVVIELTRKYHPTGGRFLVKEYPKDDEHRDVTVSRPLMAKLRAFITANSIAADDLIFAVTPREAPPPRLRVVHEPGSLGRTAPNAAGKTYEHGTKSGYSAGKCRCGHCRASYADYRADRRGGGKDRPRRIRVTETDPHISRRWFRDNVWMPAREAAGLEDGVTPQSLRHAHASWLLAGGADIARVRDRLGHSSILTTQKYLHTLPDLEEDSALSAFDKIRNRSKPTQPKGKRKRA
jgi:integrase